MCHNYIAHWSAIQWGFLLSFQLTWRPTISYWRKVRRRTWSALSLVSKVMTPVISMKILLRWGSRSVPIRETLAPAPDIVRVASRKSTTVDANTAKLLKIEIENCKFQNICWLGGVNSMIYDFHFTPSQNIHWISNFRRFFSIVVQRNPKTEKKDKTRRSH